MLPSNAIDGNDTDIALSRNRDWWRWCVAVSLVRAPAAMAPLALVLAGRAATGSFAFGGVLAAAHAIAEAVAAAPAGRLIDRMRARGSGAARATSIALLALAAAAFGATAAAVAAGASEAALVALVTAGGAAASGVPSALRAGLPALVPEPQLQRALAVDAALLEVVWVAAPAVVAGLAALASPAAAVAAMGAVAAVAAAAVPPAAARPSRGDDAPRRARPGRMLNRPTATLLLTTAAMGYAEGSIGVALPPMLDGLGREPELAGVLLAALSAAAVAGGLLYGRLHARWRLDPHRRAEVLLAVLAVGVLLLSRAGSLAEMTAAVVLVGLVVAPLNATRSYAMEHSAPDGREAEAFSLMYAAMGGGWGLSGLGLGLLLGSLGAGGALAVAGGLALAVALSALLLETGLRSHAAGAGARTS